jgi:hypothetical protein
LDNANAKSHSLTDTFNGAAISIVSLWLRRKEGDSAQPHRQDVQELPVTKVIKQTLSRVDQLPGEIQAYQDVAIYP